MGLSSGLNDEAFSAPTIQAEAPSPEPEEISDELADFDFELDAIEADNADATVMLGADRDSASSDASIDEGFSLDFDSESETSQAPEMSDADKQSLSADSVLELDDIGTSTQNGDTVFGDLNLDEMNAEFDDLSTDPVNDEELDLSLDDLDLSDETGSAPQHEVDDVLADLEIDLDLDEAEQSLVDAVEADDSLDPITSLDLEDDQSPSLDESSAVEATDEQKREDASLNIDLASVPDTSEDDASDSSSADVLADEDDFDFLGETDENATKLDLAKAYIDMGDSEGAKDILSEVISEGSAQQQNEARELLGQVG